MKRWRRPLIVIACLIAIGLVPTVVVVAVAVARPLPSASPDLEYSLSPDVGVARRRELLRSVHFVFDRQSETAGDIARIFDLQDGTTIRVGDRRRRAGTLPPNRWALERLRQENHEIVSVYAVGWPRRFLWCTDADDATRAAPSLRLRRSEYRFDGVLPLNVESIPLAMNVAFFSAVIAGPLALARFAQSRSRARRGRCPKCGYDLAGLRENAAHPTTPCPECGKPQGLERTAPSGPYRGKRTPAAPMP